MEREAMRMTAQRMMHSRAVLLRQYPFFGYLLMQMTLACGECGTACTDGKRLIFDPEFAVHLKDDELQFVMLHEVFHCILGHCVRGRGKNQSIFNIA